MPACIHPIVRTGPGEATPAASDRIVFGSGEATTWNAFSDAAGRFHVGRWRSEAGVRQVRYEETEMCVILAGRVRLTGPDGAAEFGPGDAFVIEGGFVGTWESIGAMEKIYAILEP